MATSHPGFSLTEQDAVDLVAPLVGDRRLVAALARGSQIDQRWLALAPSAVQSLGSAGARNDLYRQLAPPMAREVAGAVLGGVPPEAVTALVASSCTGYMAPSWLDGLISDFGLPTELMRLPITEAGCAGGVVSLARAADHVRLHGGTALTVAVEVCSLAFQTAPDEGNLTSVMIFGDGAGSALLESGAGEGLVVLDAMSVLIPDTSELLGFDLTDSGFSPRLERALVAALVEPTAAATRRLLARNEVVAADVGAWLLHPGGSRILRTLEQALGLRSDQTQWSWRTLREQGNASSAAIYGVLQRYLASERHEEFAVVAAFGPGMWIELLLVRST